MKFKKSILTLIMAGFIAVPVSNIANTDTKAVYAASTYKLNVYVNKYMTADNALKGVNTVGQYAPGNYYIYKTFNGMINITKKAGVPGAWINPTSNKTPEVTKPSSTTPVTTTPVTTTPVTTTPVTKPVTNTTEIVIGGKYVLTTRTGRYMTAYNAMNRINILGYYEPGTFYVFSVNSGMINITRTKGVPGSWINPGKTAVTPAPKPIPEEPSTGTSKNDWNLILVNKWNYLPKGYKVNTKYAENGRYVDSRIYTSYKSLVNAARNKGYNPLLVSGYRSHATQSNLFYSRVNNLVKQGYSYNKAYNMVAVYTAIPGTSEHQTGLAVDIVSSSHQALNNSQANTPTQKWLMNNAHNYGFILRYPYGKTSVTGIGWEPWHYRYVGKTAAQEIFRRKITLEEYLRSK